jgi:HSP20 family protein
MTMIKYRPIPFADFEESFNRLFREPEPGRGWTPSIDVFESETEVVLKADLPGVEQKDIEVKIENDTLTLKGERAFAKEDEAHGYRRIERTYGTFARHFTVPESADTANVKAEYKNGVLTVRLAKKEIAKPKTIPVEISAN